MYKLYILEFLQSHGILIKKTNTKKVACTCTFLQCKVMKQGQLFHIAENVLNMQLKLPDRLCAIASFFGVGLWCCWYAFLCASDFSPVVTISLTDFFHGTVPSKIIFPLPQNP